MTPVREAIVLPSIFLTVTMLGGFDPGVRQPWSPPSLFALVLAVLIVGALTRSGALWSAQLLGETRTMLANANGLVVLLSLFAASAQVAQMLLPRRGLPAIIMGLTFLLLLINTLVAQPDRVRLLRSLAMVFGSAYILKFIVLAALVDPEGSRLKRILLAVFDAGTLGTITQEPIAKATGYVAFFVLLAYLIGIAMLPSLSHRPGQAIVVQTRPAP